VKAVVRLLKNWSVSVAPEEAMSPGGKVPDTGGKRAGEEVVEPSNRRRKSTPVSRERATTSTPTANPAGTVMIDVQV
jgi:hypothetical protein